MINLTLIIAIFVCVAVCLFINVRLLLEKKISDPFQVAELAREGHPLAKLYLRLSLAAIALFAILSVNLIIFGA